MPLEFSLTERHKDECRLYFYIIICKRANFILTAFAVLIYKNFFLMVKLCLLMFMFLSSTGGCSS